MKFVATPAVLALLVAGNAVDAIFARPRSSHIVSSMNKYPGWLMRDSMRGGSMGRLLANGGNFCDRCRVMFDLLTNILHLY